MKQVWMICLLLGTALFVKAQEKDSTLNEYVGKYTFPEGSAVTEATIVIEGEGLLAKTNAGNSPLVKTGEDLFAVVAYDGTAQFKRDANKKVIGISIKVNGTVMEGTKADANVRDRLAFTNRTIKLLTHHQMTAHLDLHKALFKEAVPLNN